MPPAAPAQPPAPVRRQLPADAVHGGLAFHRLVFARKRFGWWTPLVVGVLGFAFYLVPIGLAAVAIGVLVIADPAIADWLARQTGALDVTDPAGLLFALGSIALMLPAYLAASRIVNGPKTGFASSAFGRLRWRWLLACTGAAALVVLLIAAVTLLLPAEWAEVAAEPAELVAPAENPHLVAGIVVILLVVPFQAAAEEYVFRGYLMQSIGRWLKHPAFAILLPVPLFVAGHAYDLLGLSAIAVFAIASGWLTWRTGGLEAAIGVHVVNNLFAFLLGSAGLADPDAQSQGLASTLVSVVQAGVFVLVVEVLYRRGERRGALRRTVVLTAPPTTAGPVPSPA
ncbi:CPBP family intramembrane metalloprotease [Agromyces sp. MMS17-SY077]|uniref:CPBP family intramembrane metalloprotease n=1 Tax=Agromyces seonyuensis TaxID=2662446 RepID=A0A6I4P1D8_9MICO|nr:CPBP family intramembrane metalloprotease [Agromyces seonyuensis]